MYPGIVLGSGDRELTVVWYARGSCVELIEIGNGGNDERAFGESDYLERVREMKKRECTESKCEPR